MVNLSNILKDMGYEFKAHIRSQDVQKHISELDPGEIFAVVDRDVILRSGTENYSFYVKRL